MMQPRPSISLAWTRGDRLALTVLVAAWAAVLAGRAASRPVTLSDPPAVDKARVDSATERVDPDTAPAASLRRLPMIGPARAEAIIEYRRTHPPPPGGHVFASAADLAKVPGIGPATTRRISPYLPKRLTEPPRPQPGAGGPTGRPPQP